VEHGVRPISIADPHDQPVLRFGRPVRARRLRAGAVDQREARRIADPADEASDD
jgi:hypothetical protein